jgi:hypothetical protein
MMRTIAKKELSPFEKYLDSLKFALYCTTHPLDGFWDLSHEKRGTYAAANTILFLAVLIRVLKLKYTSFIFITVNWERINILLYISSILLPLALFVVGNWGLTTLFEGKGRIGDIYKGVCYAMTPYVLVELPLMIISNGMTSDMAEFYSTLSSIVLIWCAFLIMAAMGQIHEFSFGKNILFIIFTLFAMLVMVFILMIFFSMITQGVAYFISLYKEILFRRI